MHLDVKNYLLVLASQSLKIVFAVLNIWILSRLLGPSGMGEWAMISSASLVLNSIFIAWTQTSFVRFGSEEWARNGSFFVTLESRLPLLLAGVCCSVLLLTLNPFQWMQKIFGISSYWSFFIFIYFLGLIFAGEVQSILQLTSRMFYLALVSVLCTSVLFIYYVSMFLLKGQTDHIQTIIMGTILVNTIYWISAYIIALHKDSRKCLLPKLNNIKKIIFYSWPLIPGFFIGYISDWGDQLLINSFYSKHEVGLFHSGYQIMYLFVMISSSLGTVIFPRLVNASIHNKSLETNYIKDLTHGIISIWVLLAIPFITVLPSLFILLTGKLFLRAELIVIVLLVVIPGEAITQLYGVLFKLQGRLFRMSVVYYGIMTAINLIISIILLPVLGILGSAIGTSISYLVCQWLFFSDQHKYLRVSPQKIYILFGTIILFGFGQAIVGEYIIQRIVFSAIFLALYIYMIRRFSLINYEVIDRIFGINLPFMASFAKKVLVSKQFIASC